VVSRVGVIRRGQRAGFAVTAGGKIVVTVEAR
jgi:hypothetical protein